MASDCRKRRRWRWTDERRAILLATLEDTGNITAAAEAAGTSFNTVRRLRRREPEFDRRCEAAIRAAHERLASAPDPFAEGDGFHAIQRTSNGRFQLSAVRKDYWSKRHDDIFFDHLRRSGNIGAAARATGFDSSAAWRRFYKWPAFARRWEKALEEADLELEFRLACHGNGDTPEKASGAAAGDAAAMPAASAPPAAGGEAFDPEFALKYLKWRGEKKAGGGRRGPAAAALRPEEARQEILRRVEAIERHLRREAERGNRAGEAR